MCVIMYVNELVVYTHVSQHLCAGVFARVEEIDRESENEKESVTDPERKSV